MISPSDVDSRWEKVLETYPNLPATLRAPQRDALTNLLNGRHSALCASTGSNKAPNSQLSIQLPIDYAAGDGKTLVQLCSTLLSTTGSDFFTSKYE